MKKKYRFFQSVQFKLPIVFVLLLTIFIELVGGYFIRELETRTIENFENSIKISTEGLITTLSTELTEANKTKDDENLNRLLSNFVSKEILEARLVDEKGVVRASSSTRLDDLVGKKNDISEINSFTSKQEEILDKDTGKRVLINIEPIQSSTGEGVIGALYVRSDIESKYKEVSDIALIFFTSSLLAVAISLIVALSIVRTITRPIGEMQKQAMKIANGDYTGQVTIYGQDELGLLAQTVNELSERVEDAQESVESERNRLDSVLFHMTDGVVATDRRGKVIIVNEMAQMMLNVTSEESVGQSIITLLDLEQDWTLRRLLETQEDVIIEQISSDEEKIEEKPTILRANFSMIRRESGFISGLVCVLHDVTEQEKNEQDRRNFVSNVSHELRTPLTSMRSYLEALNDGAWKDPEVAPNFLQVTQEETDRMIRMINDLLSLSRMDSGRSQIKLEYANLNELFDFVLDRFDMMIKNDKKNYTIKREFTKRSIWVEVDPDKIIQVLDNILNNAIKYSPKGGQITCRLLESHNNVIMSISDQGLGIPKKDLENVFERFYRVDKARSRAMGGTGLGLAISKEVIREHGGNVWVESKEGKGSTFYISLPYEPYEEDLWE